MEVRLESDLLRTFLAIVDSGSFTRAADAVGRTQSAVSMQIKKLEGIVGRPLFLRGGRGLRLTAEGEALLGDARRVLQLLDQAARSLRTEAPEGPLRVGIPEEYGASLLPRVLARFAAAHPAVEVTLHCAPSPALATALSRQELDAAVVVSDGESLPGEILLHDPTLWVTSSHHLAHEQEPLPLALFDRGCWWRDWALRALDRQRRAYRVAYTSASIAGVAAVIASGLAVGVLGRSTMPPDTRALLPEDGFAALAGSNVVLLRRSGAASAALDSMAEALRAAFRPAAPGAD
ncbi:MAG: LysR substrate-binding domain-containing protein [Kiloniellales bacterium]